MLDKKGTVLAILSILKEYSDENHPISQSKLRDLLNNQYGLDIDRRTIYSNVELLNQFDYEISCPNDNGKGYYLLSREFELAQVMLLCNAIHASNFIPKKDSKELIDKLLSTQSKYYQKEYHDTIFVDNFNKKDNKEFFLNIEVLLDAIRNNLQVSFNYMKYNDDKVLCKRREKPYICSPYYVVYENEKTYLICKNKNHLDLAHYRLDRISNVKIINEQKELLPKQDPYDYIANKLYMYGGVEEVILLKCSNEILDDIIDIFGKQIVINRIDDQFFATRVKASKKGIVYLALQYLKYLEVLEPLEIRDEIKEIIKDSLVRYK